MQLFDRRRGKIDREGDGASRWRGVCPETPDQSRKMVMSLCEVEKNERKMMEKIEKKLKRNFQKYPHRHSTFAPNLTDATLTPFKPPLWQVVMDVSSRRMKLMSPDAAAADSS